ncbi:hypothetical protein METHPM2_20098 [Pseudomonas sp. PM2]
MTVVYATRCAVWRLYLQVNLASLTKDRRINFVARNAKRNFGQIQNATLVIIPALNPAAPL